MNEKFNQLMLSEPLGMSDNEREFVEAHKQILVCGKIAGESIVELARKLKGMRDGKLYKAAGFKNFQEYVESAVGIGRTQAHNYISIVEKFDEKYLAENTGLGITKLALLASVNEETRAEIEEKVDVQSASSKELEEAMRAADEKQGQIDSLIDEVDSLRQEKDEVEGARAEIQIEYDKKKKELWKAQETVKELTTKKAELEEQLKAAQAAKTKVKTEIKTVPDETAQKEAEEQRARAEEQQARAEELDRKLKELTAELEAAKKQKKAIASDDLLLFKVKFDDIQRDWGELINTLGKMPAEQAAQCKNALKAVLAQWTEGLSV